MIEICRDHSTNVKRWQDGTMALRWCAAVTASGKFGKWCYEMVSRPEDVRAAVEKFAASV